LNATETPTKNRDVETTATKAAQHDSYDPAYFARLFDIEDRHFWFHARNRIIGTVVKQVTHALSPGYAVLEVGCGTGKVLKMLEQTCVGGTVVGMDLFGEGLHFARGRTSCALVQGDVHTPPFEAKFDMVGAFDVLEHLPDDVRVLRDMGAMLSPGGVLMLTVPAHQTLWSYFDEASHHCRRYEEKDLRRKLKQAGFEVEYLTQYMAAIFPLVWLGRRLAAIKGRFSPGASRDVDDMATDELRIVPVANGVLSWLLSLERHLMARRRKLPMGTSLLAVARKSR
jgi:SAM-dependent methyltransferase